MRIEKSSRVLCIDVGHCVTGNLFLERNDTEPSALPEVCFGHIAEVISISMTKELVHVGLEFWACGDWRFVSRAISAN
jgi:hypothetical protein